MRSDWRLSASKAPRQLDKPHFLVVRFILKLQPLRAVFDPVAVIWCQIQLPHVLTMLA